MSLSYHLQGLNFQLAAVLLSIGLYAYTENGEGPKASLALVKASDITTRFIMYTVWYEYMLWLLATAVWCSRSFTVGTAFLLRINVGVISSVVVFCMILSQFEGLLLCVWMCVCVCVCACV